MSLSLNVGMSVYDDCHEPDGQFVCLTWARHVLLATSEPCVALDPDAVRGLVAQLQGWLDKLP